MGRLQFRWVRVPKHGRGLDWTPGLLLLPLLCTILAACHVTGPRSIKTGRQPYNAAIQKTSSEQMLLNLVRLRYRDTPVFLNISSISTSFTFGASLGAAGNFRPKDNADNVGGSAGVEFAERPTITYLPLQGELFVRQLMTPLQPRTLLLLYHSGWSIDRILRVCVSRIGNILNAPSASGPTPARPPQFRDFLRISRHLRRLQDLSVLEMVKIGGDKSSAIALQVPDKAQNISAVRALARMAQLPAGSKRVVLSPQQAWFGNTPHFVLVTRSLSASMFYLSQGVQVPRKHEEAGKVTVTRELGGRRFDWRALTEDLFQVYSSDTEPKDAYVKVRYRDHWFYVRDDDLKSKSTFSLLVQLFALRAGEVQQSGPVLTLPVAQ